MGKPSFAAGLWGFFVTFLAGCAILGFAGAIIGAVRLGPYGFGVGSVAGVALALILSLVVGGVMWKRGERPAPLPPPVVGVVASQGAELAEHIMGQAILGRIGPGATLVEVRRAGSRVLVKTEDGMIGWVDSSVLVPIE